MAVATFRAFNSKTYMSIVISNCNKCLEASSLTCTSLFLDRHNFQNFIFQCRSNKEVDNFELFDGKRKQVDLLKGLDLSILTNLPNLVIGTHSFSSFPLPRPLPPRPPRPRPRPPKPPLNPPRSAGAASAMFDRFVVITGPM